METKRAAWRNKREYLLSCIGYAVGLGNIWRFPYLCSKSGGGAFLIPYIIMLIFCGLPLLYLELGVGQWTRFGPVHAIEKLCPLMKGVGIATVVITFILSTYYSVILTWAMYYFIQSFQDISKLFSCNHIWSSENCVNTLNATNVGNISGNLSAISPFEDVFDRMVLQKTNSISDMGGMQWELFGCFVMVWIVTYFCLFKGIESAGKVVYFTVTFPYVILVVLVVACCTLEGATNGVYYFLKPDWTKLLEVKGWVNAAAQIFNSIGIGFGSLIAFSSYNKRRNNILQDTFIIAGVNSATSILAGVVVFSAMGHIAHVLQVDVSQVAKAGPDLVFITYPQIFLKLPLPSLWMALFFLMLLCLGIDSQFAMIEVVSTTLTDAYNTLILRYFKRKEYFVLALCLITALLGIPNLMQGGIYVFTLLDNYTAIVSLMIIAFFEVIALCWMFGANRLCDEVSKMIEVPTPLFFRICLRFVSPFLIGIILIFTVIQYKPIAYKDYTYPVWANVIGWMITLCSIVCIPAFAILLLSKKSGDFFSRLQQAVQPSPSLQEHELEYMEEEKMKLDIPLNEKDTKLDIV